MYRNYYITEWNYPSNFSYVGNVSNASGGCACSKYAGRVRVNVGALGGFNFSVQVRIGINVADVGSTRSVSYAVNMNGVNILQENVSISTLSQCSDTITTTYSNTTTNITTSISSCQYSKSLTIPLPQFPPTSLYPYNPQLPTNYL